MRQNVLSLAPKRVPRLASESESTCWTFESTGSSPGHRFARPHRTTGSSQLGVRSPGHRLRLGHSGQGAFSRGPGSSDPGGAEFDWHRTVRRIEARLARPGARSREPEAVFLAPSAQRLPFPSPQLILSSPPVTRRDRDDYIAVCADGVAHRNVERSRLKGWRSGWWSVGVDSGRRRRDGADACRGRVTTGVLAIQARTTKRSKRQLGAKGQQRTNH
jgi:hypothetical protein